MRASSLQDSRVQHYDLCVYFSLQDARVRHYHIFHEFVEMCLTCALKRYQPHLMIPVDSMSPISMRTLLTPKCSCAALLSPGALVIQDARVPH